MSYTIRRVASALLISAAVITAGCQKYDQDEEEVQESKPVEVIYNEALDAFENEKYKDAAKLFGEVERQHPYSNWAVKALLLSAYSSFKAREYEEAIESYRVFIRLHPGHSEVANAYYMIGLCYYEQIPVVDRDQYVTDLAKQALHEVVVRYPGTKYAKDAKFKLDFIEDHLAGHEMVVGRFYLRGKSYAAALERFKVVTEKHQQTSHIAEALHRMVECYVAMGLRDQARMTAAVLAHNYPGSEWYQYTYDLISESDAAYAEKLKSEKTQAVKAQKTAPKLVVEKPTARDEGMPHGASERAVTEKNKKSNTPAVKTVPEKAPDVTPFKPASAAEEHVKNTSATMENAPNGEEQKPAPESVIPVPEPADDGYVDVSITEKKE